MQTQVIQTVLNESAEEQSASCEKTAPAASGMSVFLLNLLLLLSSFSLIVLSVYMREFQVAVVSLIMILIAFVIFFGFKTLKPNEAFVLTLFGSYYGTLTGPGFFFVNPFCVGLNPPAYESSAQGRFKDVRAQADFLAGEISKKISLKPQTLSINKQKICDALGHPVLADVAVIWKITDTAAAVFGVENYKEYLAISCSAALRDVICAYPYDSADASEKTLRGGAGEINEKLRGEIQKKTRAAGLEILDATVTHLSYAPEIASAMLQKQKAKAMVCAKALIAEGAADIAFNTVKKLSAKSDSPFSKEKEAQMLGSLLTVLCASQDVRPVFTPGDN